MLSILRDVSEQKQAESEREAMLAQLAEKNRELDKEVQDYVRDNAEKLHGEMEELENKLTQSNSAYG